MSTGQMPPRQFDQPGTPPPERSRATTMPTLLSGLALIVALVAAGVSLVALSRTGDGSADAGPTAAPTEPVQSGLSTATDAAPTDSLPTDSTDTTDPTGEPTSEPTDAPDPAGVYEVAYQAEPLTLQPSARYIDLDAPSGNASANANETQYETGNRLSFNSDVALAAIGSPSATANDCVKQLRRAPIDPNFVPSKGQMICVLTSRQAADDQGIRQKVVLMKVNSIAQDGTLNLTLTAWTVPR